MGHYKTRHKQDPIDTPGTENGGKFIMVVQQKQGKRWGKKDHSFRHHAWGLNKQGMGSAFDKWPVSVLQKEAEITIGRNHATGISCCFIDVCKAVGVGHSKKRPDQLCYRNHRSNLTKHGVLLRSWFPPISILRQRDQTRHLPFLMILFTQTVQNKTWITPLKCHLLTSEPVILQNRYHLSLSYVKNVLKMNSW